MRILPATRRPRYTCVVANPNVTDDCATLVQPSARRRIAYRKCRNPPACEPRSCLHLHQMCQYKVISKTVPLIPAGTRDLWIGYGAEADRQTLLRAPAFQRLVMRQVGQEAAVAVRPRPAVAFFHCRKQNMVAVGLIISPATFSSPQRQGIQGKRLQQRTDQVERPLLRQPIRGGESHSQTSDEPLDFLGYPKKRATGQAQ